VYFNNQLKYLFLCDSFIILLKWFMSFYFFVIIYLQINHFNILQCVFSLIPFNLLVNINRKLIRVNLLPTNVLIISRKCGLMMDIPHTVFTLNMTPELYFNIVPLWERCIHSLHHDFDIFVVTVVSNEFKLIHTIK